MCDIAPTRLKGPFIVRRRKDAATASNIGMTVVSLEPRIELYRPSCALMPKKTVNFGKPLPWCAALGVWLFALPLPRATGVCPCTSPPAPPGGDEGTTTAARPACHLPEPSA